jgi:hypothetical protein
MTRESNRCRTKMFNRQTFTVAYANLIFSSILLGNKAIFYIIHFNFAL